MHWKNQPPRLVQGQSAITPPTQGIPIVEEYRDFNQASSDEGHGSKDKEGAGAGVIATMHRTTMH